MGNVREKFCTNQARSLADFCRSCDGEFQPAVRHQSRFLEQEGALAMV